MDENQRQAPLINHSQLEDQRRSWEESWARRTGFKKGNPIGIHIPLGHTYSMILEELAREGVPIKPNSAEFLEFLTQNSRREIPKKIDLSEPSFVYAYGQAIYGFMVRNGLSLEGSYKIMKEICGYDEYLFEPASSKIYTDKMHFDAGKKRREQLLVELK